MILLFLVILSPIALLLVTTIDIVRPKNHTFAVSTGWSLKRRDMMLSLSSSFMWLLLLSSSCLILMGTIWCMSDCQHPFKTFTIIQHTREVNMMTIKRTTAKYWKIPQSRDPQESRFNQSYQSNGLDSGLIFLSRSIIFWLMRIWVLIF